jgi:hypothetical protein
VLLEVAGNATARPPRLAHIDATPPIPEDIDVGAWTEVLIEPSVEGRALVVGTSALSTLAVPTPLLLNTS